MHYVCASILCLYGYYKSLWVKIMIKDFMENILIALLFIKAEIANDPSLCEISLTLGV